VFTSRLHVSRITAWYRVPFSIGFSHTVHLLYVNNAGTIKNAESGGLAIYPWRSDAVTGVKCRLTNRDSVRLRFLVSTKYLGNHIHSVGALRQVMLFQSTVCLGE
jgi:hypothetical protein